MQKYGVKEDLTAVSEVGVPNKISFRKAAMADVEFLENISRESFPDDIVWQGMPMISRKWWEFYIGSESREVWVCLDNGEIVGFLVLLLDQAKGAHDDRNRRPHFLLRMSAFVFCPGLVFARVVNVITVCFRKIVGRSKNMMSQSQLLASVSSKSASHLWLELIAVSPQRRKQGLATRMWRFAEDGTLVLARDVIKLWVRISSTQAIRLYERAGFTCLGQTSSGYLYYTKALRK